MRSSARYLQSGMLVLLLLLLVAEVMPRRERGHGGARGPRDWRASAREAAEAAESAAAAAAAAGDGEGSEGAAEGTVGGELPPPVAGFAATGRAVGGSGSVAMCARVLGAVKAAAEPPHEYE